MSRVILSVMVVGVMAIAIPALAEEIEVDADWYSQSPSSPPTAYQPNPKAIIHRKALERSAYRTARLESMYGAGRIPARPTVNPLNGSWQYTYPVGYVYGPPVVSDDWGNTQVTTLGDGNRTTTPWLLGAQPTYNR